MANRIVKNSELKHYWDEPTSPTLSPPHKEPDKSKSISDLSKQELWDMLSRTRDELELQRILKELKRNSGEKDTYENPMIVDTITPINRLYHYGTKGQRWGIRRFQNPDGTRTPEGKKRDAQNEKKKETSDDHKTSRNAKSKAPEGLSNDELRKLNERLQLEENYKKLTAEKMDKSESWVKTSIRNAGQQAVTDFTKGLFLGSAKMLVKEISPQFAEAAFGIKEKEKKKGS